jgi:hypothetical protein
MHEIPRNERGADEGATEERGANGLQEGRVPELEGLQGAGDYEHPDADLGGAEGGADQQVVVAD